MRKQHAIRLNENERQLLEQVAARLGEKPSGAVRIAVAALGRELGLVVDPIERAKTRRAA
jgi:hypothetical protein